MSTAVVTKIAEKHIAAGAQVIATLDIASRMSDDVEIEARNLLGIGYECTVAWQDVIQPIFAADSELNALERYEERKARKIEIVSQMVERFLATRR
jgi:hypothetical protein